MGLNSCMCKMLGWFSIRGERPIPNLEIAGFLWNLSEQSVILNLIKIKVKWILLKGKNSNFRILIILLLIIVGL